MDSSTLIKEIDMNNGGIFVYALCKVDKRGISIPSLAFIDEDKAIQQAKIESENRHHPNQYEVRSIWVANRATYGR
jgi:hypothetical protein